MLIICEKNGETSRTAPAQLPMEFYLKLLKEDHPEVVSPKY